MKDFVIGNVSDILNQKAVDLISPATSEKLTTNGETGANYSDLGLHTGWDSFEAQWTPASPLPAELQNVTIAELYQLQWQQKRPDTQWQRYASYTVTVSFRGQSRPYKALFLFGHDAQGNEVVEPEDGTTSAGALGLAMYLHLFPEAFVLTRLRTVPIVASWLNANQMPGPNCSTSGPNGDLCCDLVRMKCGPRSEDVAAGLAKPLPTQNPKE